jgi:DNA replication licensing factor MCM4
VHPRISEDAIDGLIQGYLAMRRFGSTGGRKVISATTRQLESLIRVAEAHARMRYDMHPPLFY